MATQRAQAELKKKEILRAWDAGGSIASISRGTGLNRNSVRALLESEGVRGARSDPRGEERSERRRQVLFWIRQHPGSTLQELAEAVNLPARTAAGYLDGTDEEALLVQSRVKSSEFTPESIMEHMRQVWASLPADERGRGLSKARYIAAVKGAGGAGVSGHPSTALIEKRFPTWSAACIAAGIPAAARTRKTYTRMFTAEDMEGAVSRFIAETGETSFSAYSAWAKRNRGMPSGSLVITRYGRWSNVRRAVASGQGKAA
jgi:hypothetical protein